ncbi:MAG: GAF domain-containing protein [Anaerolineae bacterium]
MQVEEFVSLEDELRHFVTVKFPLRDASGGPYALCGLSTEITQQKRLEQQLHKAAERRNRQIQLSAQIAHDIAATTHLAELYQRVLTRINEQFGFYHTQLFRYQAHLEALIPVAGYGEAGKQIVAEGQRLKLGVGLIGAAAATGSSLLRPDLSTEARWQPHPLLPATKGELAVPITLGGEDSEAQVTALRYFVESEFDGFIVIPLDTAAVAPAAQQALRAGKPVVSISNDLGKQNQTALIMSVEHQLGYLLGQQAGEWTKKHLAAGETLNLGLLTYLKPFGGLPEREQGIIDGLTEAFGNNFNVLWHRVEGTPAPGLLDWLKLHPELKMVLGLTDGLALDAYQAVIAAGKNEAQTFFVGGVDALPEALAAIKAVGAFQATVTQSPREMGIVALRTLVAAIKGLPYEPVTSIQHVPVNLTNVDEFLTDNSIIPLDTNLAGLDLSDLKIGFSTLNLTNPFFISMVESAQAEAARLGIQLVINNPRRVLGVLDVQTDQPGVLAVEDQLVLEGLAAQIAAAIESTRLRQDAEERLQEVSALQRLMTREGWQAYQAASQQAQTAYLFKQGVAQPIAVAELPQLGNGAAQPEPAKNDGHMVAKPMAVHGEVIGALGIQVEPDNPLTYEDEQFLAAMSEQVAEALERARLLNQTQKRAGEMETVTQVGVVAASTLEVQELLQTIVELTKSRFGLYHAHIYLLDEAGADLVLVAGAGEPGRQMVAQGWRISLNHSSSIVALTARNRHGVIVNDTHQNPNFLPNPLLPATRSELAVPMLAGDKLLGVLDVQAEVANRFTDDDAKIKTILANQVAIALQNARLFDEHQRARHLLNERIKELNCLNDIGREIEETPAIPDFLEWVAQRIPSATQHPELCRVAIEFDGHTYGLAEAIDIPYQMTHGLRVGNEVVGRIYIAYTQKQDFLNEESALLGGVARRVSGYIENRRLFDQTQANLAESSTLYRLGTELNQVRTFEELVDVIASIETDTKIDGITILTLEVDQAGNPEWAEIVASRITLDQPALPNGTRLYLPQFPLSSLWIDDPYTVIAIENIATDERIDPITRTAFGSNDNMADVILPLAVAGRWIGLIALTWPSAQVFTDKDKRIFQSAARQIAVVMNNQLLFAQTQANLAETDALYQLSAQLNAANNFDDIVDVIASIETDTKVEAVTLLTLDIDPSGKPEWGEVVATRTPPGQSALPTGTRFYLPQFPLSFLWIDDPYGIVVLENIAADERVDPVTKALFDNINNGATIILPLAIAGQWVGLFSLGWTSAQVFTEKDKRILQSVARQIAVVMNNQLLFAQTQAALTQTQAVLGETNTLFRVAQDLAQIEDERMMFEFVLSEYLRTLNLSQGGVVIIDDSDSGYGTLRALMVGGKLVEPGLRVPMIGNPAAEKVINTRRAVAISDALQDPLMEPVRDFVHQMGYKSILLAPIVVRERVYGILGADSVEIIHEFTDREIAFVQAMADQLGIALENRRLLAEAQAALAQVEATQRRYTVQAWETYLAKNKAVSYEQAREGVAPLGENLLPQINQAIMEGRQPAAQSHSLLVSPVQPDETDSSLIVPLAVRGQTIGVLGLQETNPTETWSPEEVALVEAIARQIAEAAESLRLVDETQQQAARERRVNEIGEKIQRAQSLEEALQIAIKEVGLSLQAPQTSVQLEVQ